MNPQEVTTLTAVEEAAFRKWATENGIADVDTPQSFYDYRGFFKNNGPVPIKFGVDHFPDTFKQHGHPTFSVESRYSQGPQDGGHWVGESFVPAGVQMATHSASPKQKDVAILSAVEQAVALFKKKK